MNKLKIIIPFIVLIVAVSLFSLGAGEGNGTAYLTNSTNSAVTDTITTAGDSADGSYTFLNKDYKWKYLVVEYIQAAAPIKQLIVASDNVYGLKMTYDEADSTLKLWSSRQLGWVQVGFYIQTTSSETHTISGTLSGNDTLTSGLTDQITDQSTGAQLNDSVRTITGTVINDKSTTIAETNTITKTDPNTIVYEITVTPDSGTKKCIFVVRGTNYLVGY